jgi:hypothetical protein
MLFYLPTFLVSSSFSSGADQRSHGGPEPTETRPSHEQGKENSHLNLDAKDEKSIANKLDQASKQEKREEAAEEANKKPPTAAAREVSRTSNII